MENQQSNDYMNLPEREAYEKGLKEGKKIYDVTIKEDLDHIKQHMSMSEYASPVINNIPDGGHGYDGGLGALAGILPIALLAPLLGLGRGFGREGGRDIEAVVAEGISDLRQEVEGVKAGVRETVFQEALNNANKFGTLEKEAAEARLESKIAALEATNKIENKVGECCEETQKAFCSLRSDMDKQFCHVERMIEDKFTHLEIAHKNEEIESLKSRIAVQDTVTAILTAVGVPSPIVPLAKKV